MIWRKAKRLSARIAVLVVVVALAIGGWAGWLRLTGNVHVTEAGQFIRTAQLSTSSLTELLRSEGIRTVVNLRGESPREAWYVDEVAATRRAGAEHLSFRLSANQEPDDQTLEAVAEVLRHAPRPLLVHCEGGADRTGLVAAMFEFLVEGRAADVAAGQLSFRFGHFPWLFSRTSAMDRSFARVVERATRSERPARTE